MSACQTEAIRGAIAPATEAPESRLFLAAALEDVDRLLFEAAALAPRGGVLRRALEGLALRENIDAVADPDLFDVERRAQGHVGFGFGKHFCLGSSLARLEARCVLEALLPHLAERARRELERLLKVAVGPLPPRGEERELWRSGLFETIQLAYAGR